MNRTNGKIAEQSKKELTQGLLTLMATYPFSDITVTQIAQEAKLSRRTFYRLFHTKEEMISQLLDQYVFEFFEEIKKHDTHHYWDTVLLYFSFWEKRKDFLVLLKDHSLLYLLYQKTFQSSYELLSIEKPYRKKADEDPCLSYGIAYSMGGMNQLLIHWIEDGMRIEPSLFINYIHYGMQSETI